MTITSFLVHRPRDQQTSVIFASPHSGRNYSRALMDQTLLDMQAIRSSEDAFVDELFSSAIQHGAPLLLANAPRAFLDLNRASDDLDPALITGVRKAPQSARVTNGLGVVPRVVANGRHIYHGKISLEEANRRISEYWQPYHTELQKLILENKRIFGEAILIDCHSMPDEALRSATRKGTPRPDIVLGDRFGGACSKLIVDKIEAAFTSAGFQVARNQPFAGAYIAQRYGHPAFHQHVVQIEINRSLYMNEKQITRLEGFYDFRSRLDRVIAKIVEIGRPRTSKIAAE